MWAAQNGLLNIVKYLHSKGGDIKAKGNYAIIHASMLGKLEMVKYLYEQGADIKGEYNEPLTTAVVHGQLDVAKFLISKGADIKACDEYIFEIAKKKGNLKTVEYIKSLKA